VILVEGLLRIMKRPTRAALLSSFCHLHRLPGRNRGFGTNLASAKSACCSRNRDCPGLYTLLLRALSSTLFPFGPGILSARTVPIRSPFLRLAGLLSHGLRDAGVTLGLEKTHRYGVKLYQHRQRLAEIF